MDKFTVEDNYNYIEYPYISKSTFNQFEKCPYYFKRMTLEGVRFQGTNIMVEGSALHYMFYKFFELIDLDYLMTLDWRAHHDTRYSIIYNYFYTVLMGQLPENANNPNMIHNIKGFSRMEENHWYELRERYKDKKTIRRYFRPGPKSLEKFVRNDYHKLFGTIDRKSIEEDKTVIIDYKTGRTPKGVIRESGKGLYNRGLPGKFTREGNFYVLLYLLHSGYQIILDDNGKWNIHKENGEMCNDILRKYDYAFVYTKGKDYNFPDYHIARKNSHIVSIRSIMKKIYQIRECREFPRKPNYMVCQWCQLFLSECKDVVPLEIYGNVLRSENTSQESVQNMDTSKG